MKISSKKRFMQEYSRSSVFERWSLFPPISRVYSYTFGFGNCCGSLFTTVFYYRKQNREKSKREEKGREEKRPKEDEEKTVNCSLSSPTDFRFFINGTGSLIYF